MIKKNLCALILVLTQTTVGMDNETAAREKELVRDLLPQPTAQIVVQQGFGQRFNFDSLLKSTNPQDLLTYKRRLQLFSQLLRDVTYEPRISDQPQTKESGNLLKFLRTGLHTPLIIQSTAQSIPYFTAGQNRIRVANFIPEKELAGTQYGKIEFKKNNIPCGFIGAFIAKQETIGSDIRATPSVPLFLVTEPDAEAILITFAQSEFISKGLDEKIAIGLNFAQQAKKTSLQASVLVDNMLHMLYHQKRASIPAQYPNATKQNVLTKNSDDLAALQQCTFACPHLLNLAFLQEQLIHATSLAGQQQIELFNNINNYSRTFDTLSNEYATIYERVQETLRKLEPTATPSPAPVKTITPIAPQCTQTPIQKIKYAKRVLDWFKDDFHSHPDLLYHAVVPIIADSLAISHGKKSPYRNKTYSGQIDYCHSMAGKVIDETTNEESFGRFDVTINPKGICYHRGFKKCTWQQLSAALQESCDIKDDQVRDETDSIQAPANVARILNETTFSATIHNPTLKHRIILYKNLCSGKTAHS